MPDGPTVLGVVAGHEELGEDQVPRWPSRSAAGLFRVVAAEHTLLRVGLASGPDPAAVAAQLLVKVTRLRTGSAASRALPRQVGARPVAREGHVGQRGAAWLLEPAAVVTASCR